MNLWPHQSRAIEQFVSAAESGVRRICITSPTGGGKTLVICRLLEWAAERGWPAVLYTNRKLLTEQMIRVLSGHGISFGVRAAGFDDHLNLDAPIQISSLQTEEARVFRSQKWILHRSRLAIFDEAHLQKSGMAMKVMEMHEGHGSIVAGFTATPVGLAKIYDRLIVAGTTSELRACGALVPAFVYAPGELDTKNLKPQATGEFSIGDIRKHVWTPTIFGHVYDHWKQLNPDSRPTLLFGPGVPESQWFAQKFEERGVLAAHIDGEDVYVDGQSYPTSREARDEVLERFKAGEVKVLCNRFVLREGIDLPVAYHGILATPIGSVTSYIQIVGRLLRSHPTTPEVLITDHGGNWHRHGSPNADRDWESLWALTDYQIHERRAAALMEKRENEGIVCPECGAVRMKGPACHKCGFRHTKKCRMVIQKSGELKPMFGDIYRERKTQRKPETERLWTSMYYRMLKAGKTFKQAEGFFRHLHHHWPPHDLPFMPKDPLDWERKIRDVPKDRLVQPGEVPQAQEVLFS